MKKLTYQELEERKNAWRFLVVFFSVFTLIFFTFFIITSLLRLNLVKELQECQEEIKRSLCDDLVFTDSEYLIELCCCQEKTEVWFLRVHCDYGSTEEITMYKFDSYSLYKGFLENYEEHWDKESCEVIE